MSKNKISVILAHPDKNSFNHAIALKVIETLKNNKYYIFYHDLYQENYDPVLTKQEISEEGPVPERILNYCREIIDSDGIIIIHPNWWGQPPAILKGWIDRVMRPGIAYKFIEGDLGDGIPVGLLKAKIGIVFNTSNTPEERELNIFKDPLELLWRKCIFELCGVKKFYRKMYRCIITSTPGQRKEWLLEIESIIHRYFPEM
jgi:NAD(P)H dehydrogenase (quinone)